MTRAARQKTLSNNAGSLYREVIDLHPLCVEAITNLGTLLSRGKRHG
jgi:hypothetical protein